MINRRSLLRGTGVAMALPMLESVQTPPTLANSTHAGPPRRMVCVCSNMGMMPEYFWPRGTGRDYVASDYLEPLQRFRDDLTVFSGVSHPDVDGGHHAEPSYLTAAPHPSSAGFQNTISLDQYAAERIGFQTRFPYLALNVGNENATLSWTASGVKIPAQSQPSQVFRQLFVRGTEAEVAAQVQRLADGRSVLDLIGERARRLSGQVSSADRQKLDQYFGSVREAERRLHRAEGWSQTPKPVVDAAEPVDIEDRAELIGRTELMFRMAALALQTDSTRIVTLIIDQNSNPKVNLPGVNENHHSLTHHGRRKESVEQLRTIELNQMKVLAEFLGSLRRVEEAGGDLLERTSVLYGSNLGNANSHDNRNLPMILAGGGFRHGGHVAFDNDRNEPLANLYVSMLQRMGIETDRFASGTGTIRGLEIT